MPDQRLLEWLKLDLQRLEHAPSDEALIELIEDSKRLSKLYLERPRKLRPSAVAGELDKLAKGFEMAAKAAEKLGNQGFLIVAAISEANHDPDDRDVRRHILYLQRMAA